MEKPKLNKFSKTAKRLQKLLPPFAIPNTERNSLFSEDTPTLKHMFQNFSIEDSHPKAKSFFDCSDSSSISQSTKKPLCPLKPRPKPHEKLIKNQNIKDFKPIKSFNVNPPKKAFDKSNKTEIVCQAILEEPDNIRELENHPRIRKSFFSKADRLMRDWLDCSGRITEEQNKILGSSERTQKKALYYYINQKQEKSKNLILFIDQKLLKRKKFVLASRIINEHHNDEIMSSLDEIFGKLKELRIEISEFPNILEFMKVSIEKAKKMFGVPACVYLMKFFGKMLILFHDYGNSRNLLKTALFLAKTNSFAFDLMSLHKRVGGLYRQLNKPKIALKHFLRMLDLAWFLDDEQYEVIAYDEIGLCYYYLGDIDRANYYHLKMLEGDKEEKNSAGRGLGLLKVRTMLEKPVHLQEALLNLSKESSDEEDELLFGETKQKVLDLKSKIELSIFMKKQSAKMKEQLSFSSLSPTERLCQQESRPNIPLLDKREPRPRRFVLGNRELLLMNRTITFAKKPQLVTHLSRNRNLMNFYEFQTQPEEENVELHREILRLRNKEVKGKVEARNLEKLRTMVKKLKANLEVCILYFENLKTPEEATSRMLIKPMKP